MKRGFIAVACLVVGGLAASASGLSLVASTAIPHPGTEITFQVTGAPAGAEFRWDLNGDGRPDAMGNQPWATWTVPAGYWEVTVDVVHAGNSLARLSTAVVADSRLAAVREVRWTQAQIEVTVTIQARARIFGPGLVVDVPPGWGASALGSDRSVSTTNEQGQLEFLISEAVELYPGEQVTTRYLLIPPSPNAVVKLKSWATGLCRTDSGMQRLVIPVAGPMSP